MEATEATSGACYIRLKPTVILNFKQRNSTEVAKINTAVEDISVTDTTVCSARYVDHKNANYLGVLVHCRVAKWRLIVTSMSPDDHIHAVRIPTRMGQGRPHHCGTRSIPVRSQGHILTARNPTFVRGEARIRAVRTRGLTKPVLVQEESPYPYGWMPASVWWEDRIRAARKPTSGRKRVRTGTAGCLHQEVRLCAAGNSLM